MRMPPSCTQCPFKSKESLTVLTRELKEAN